MPSSTRSALPWGMRPLVKFRVVTDTSPFAFARRLEDFAEEGWTVEHFCTNGTIPENLVYTALLWKRED